MALGTLSDAAGSTSVMALCGTAEDPGPALPVAWSLKLSASQWLLASCWQRHMTCNLYTIKVCIGKDCIGARISMSLCIICDAPSVIRNELGTERCMMAASSLSQAQLDSESSSPQSSSPSECCNSYTLRSAQSSMINPSRVELVTQNKFRFNWHECISNMH